MNNQISAAIDVDAVMQDIRQQVARRRVDSRSAPEWAAASDKDIEQRASYTISDLLSYEGSRFIRNAYLALLRRAPEPHGSAVFLDDLRKGRRTKLEIIQALRYSTEGRAAAVPIRGLNDIAPDVVPMPRLIEASSTIGAKTAYQAKEFLALHDFDFVRNAYVGILRREPELAEINPLLERLRRGTVGKIDILVGLRDSPEGRSAAVPVHGLLPRRMLRALCRVPVIGRLFSIVLAVVRLPSIVGNQQRLETALFQHRRDFTDAYNGLVGYMRSTIAGRVDANAREIENLSAEVPSARQMGLLTQRLDGVAAALKPLVEHELTTISNVTELQRKLESALRDTVTRSEHAQAMQGKLDVEAFDTMRWDATAAAEELNAQLNRLREHLTECERNIFDQRGDLRRFLDERESAIGAGRPASTGTSMQSTDHVLDAFYASFEDNFRGSPAEIRERVEAYMPIVRESGAGTAERPIVDIGCGRGEWLGVLTDNGLTARGVDLNRVMIDRCTERKLDVVQADALDYLRTLQANSTGAVTGMHIIEHLPFEPFIGLLDEVFRVLAPGGVAIFETPNPENVLVGACGFWADPTHNRPIVPETASFIFESRGFVAGRILRLHPASIEARLPESADPMWGRLNHLMYGPRDYSIVAYKPGAALHAGAGE